MNASDFIDMLKDKLGVGFFTGVPDSLLGPFVSEVIQQYGISDNHIIAANEGNAAALAAGYHLATGKIPCVYMQNSGQGNMLNPYASLLHPDVYKIPAVFVIGFRGQPGIKDEPQHIFQGKITNELMELLGIHTVVVSEDDSIETLSDRCQSFEGFLKKGECVGFVVKKGALTVSSPAHYSNAHHLKREEIIDALVSVSGDDIIVCTTGKASRELFEIRTRNEQSHKFDFLTVGSMGHSSSIALEVALQKKNKTVWCIDGDGALLMHMGAMAVIGSMQPDNYIHVLINNESHETVGGMPTVAGQIDFQKIAQGCGYKNIYQADDLEGLKSAAADARRSGQLAFIEVKASIGARADLGRPTTTAEENKQHFMEYLREI